MHFWGPICTQPCPTYLTQSKCDIWSERYRICYQVSVVHWCEAEQGGGRCWWRERERGVGTATAERSYNTSDRYQPSSSIHVALLPSAPLVLRSKVLKLPSWLPMAPFFLLLSLSKFFIVMLPLCELQKPSSSCENSLRKMPPDG